MIQQIEFSLPPHERGVYLITDEVIKRLPALPKTGILHLFIKHTSAGITINENVDPRVRIDLNSTFDMLIEEGPWYLHKLEGDDDMPAHAKSSIIGSSIIIPITNGKLNLGIWQGIHLCEFRFSGSSRTIVATVIGE